MNKQPRTEREWNPDAPFCPKSLKLPFFSYPGVTFSSSSLSVPSTYRCHSITVKTNTEGAWVGKFFRGLKFSFRTSRLLFLTDFWIWQRLVASSYVFDCLVVTEGTNFCPFSAYWAIMVRWSSLYNRYFLLETALDRRQVGQAQFHPKKRTEIGS